MDEGQDIPEIHWRNRPSGNKWMEKLHPAMLLPDGYRVLTQICLKSTGRRRASPNEKEWVNVIYDETYIIEKIRRELLQPLNPKDYKALQTIISKAWKVHKTIS